MDWELLETWGIEKDSDPKSICDALEERQLTLLQMRRSESDSEKKAEIENERKNVENQLKLAKKEAKKKIEDSDFLADSLFDEIASEDDEIASEEAEEAWAEAMQLDYAGDDDDDMQNYSPVKPIQPITVPASSQLTGVKKGKQLKNILTGGKKRESKGKILNVIEILSSILLIFGFLYLLGGTHPDEWNKNALLSAFPNASAILIIPFHLFWMLILPELTVNGQFGLELITLAYTFRSIYLEKRGKNKSTLSIVSKLIVAVIIVWHLLLVIMEEIPFSEGIVYFVLAVVVCRIFGFIISKVILVVKDTNPVAKRVVLSVVIVGALVFVNLLTARIPAVNEMIKHSVRNDVKTDNITDESTEENTDENEKNIQPFVAGIIYEDISNCQIINVSSIKADSVLISAKGNHYEPEFMIDGDIATSWQEGEDGAGEGITFTAGFEGETKVDYIVIYNGNQKSEKLYADNNRICLLCIIVNGQPANVELADTMDPQIIRLEGADMVTEIKFEIISVYGGNKYNDTCVAEVQFFCE